MKQEKNRLFWAVFLMRAGICESKVESGNTTTLSLAVNLVFLSTPLLLV